MIHPSMIHPIQRWKRVRIVALTAAAMLAAGCHGRPYRGAATNVFTVAIRNQGPAIRLLEVDYPSASFGTDTLASGATYRYQPKLIGSGPVKVAFTDAAGKSHTATGPTLQEGERNQLTIVIGEDESVHFELTPDQHS